VRFQFAALFFERPLILRTIAQVRWKSQARQFVYFRKYFNWKYCLINLIYIFHLFLI